MAGGETKILKRIFAISVLSLATISTGYLNQNHKKGIVLGISTANQTNSPREEVYFGQAGLDLGQMLLKDNVTVYPEDKISVFPNPTLGLGSRIIIDRAYKIYVSDAGSQNIYRTWQENVGKFLEEKNIQVGQEDVLNVPKEALIADNLQIQITRVKQSEEFETISIGYKEIKQNDTNMLLGNTKVLQAGEQGIRQKKYTIRRENGQIVDKVLIEDKIIKEPKDKIVTVGTKILVLSTQEGECSWLKGITSSVKYRKGTLVKVTNKANGKSVKVTVGGWGPQPSTGRILDLNLDAFSQIANPDVGHIEVLVEEVTQ